MVKEIKLSKVKVKITTVRSIYKIISRWAAWSLASQSQVIQVVASGSLSWPRETSTNIIIAIIKSNNYKISKDKDNNKRFKPLNINQVL